MASRHARKKASNGYLLLMLVLFSVLARPCGIVQLHVLHRCEQSGPLMQAWHCAAGGGGEPGPGAEDLCTRKKDDVHKNKRNTCGASNGAAGLTLPCESRH